MLLRMQQPLRLHSLPHTPGVREYYITAYSLLSITFMNNPRANTSANMTLHNVIMQAVYINNSKHGQHDIF